IDAGTTIAHSPLVDIKKLFAAVPARRYSPEISFNDGGNDRTISADLNGGVSRRGSTSCVANLVGQHVGAGAHIWLL
ncbi:hypothetical protein GGX14DRAFT_502627, partial [Mycena pura]